MPSEPIDRINITGRGMVSFQAHEPEDGDITLKFLLTGDFSLADRTVLLEATGKPARTSPLSIRGSVLRVKMLTSAKYGKKINEDVEKYVPLVLQAMQEAVDRLPKIAPRKRTVRDDQPTAPVEMTSARARRLLGG